MPWIPAKIPIAGITGSNGQGFTINSTRKIPFRSIGINLTWKFGKLEFKKSKPERGDQVQDNQ